MSAWLASALAWPLAFAAGGWLWYRSQRKQELARIVTAIRNSDAGELALLLSEGLPLNSVADEFGEPVLILVLKSPAAGSCGTCFSLLLSHGADVNETGTEWKSPLMHAAAVGCRDVCELLLSCGADPGARDLFGRTAADWAEREGHRELADLLRAADRSKTRMR